MKGTKRKTPPTQKKPQEKRPKHELKHYDDGKAAYAITASSNWLGTEADPATTLCFFAPTQGAAYNQRIGTRCYVTSLKINGYIYAAVQAAVTTAATPCLIRLVVFLDKQSNGAQAQGEDIMKNEGSANLTPVSFQNVANFGRFKVLKDMRIVLENPNALYDGTNADQYGLLKHFEIRHKFNPPLEVKFNTTNGGTIADILDNSFHMVTATNNVDLVPTMYYTSRVTFFDA